MLNHLARARLVGIWCMSVLTIGALGITLGADLTTLNGELLLLACVIPPVLVMVVWRHTAPVALTVS